MKRLSRRLALAALLGPLSLAGATYAPPLTLDQQAVKAEVIVRATLNAPSSVQDSGQTWTVYPLEIQETLAGDAQSLPKYQNKPSVWLLGSIDAGPSLPPSGEVMLLLYKSRFDSPLVGFTQGLYSVQAGSAAGSKVVVGLPAGTPGVAAVPAAPAPASNPAPAKPAGPGSTPTSPAPARPTPTAPATAPTTPPVATTAAPETPPAASPPPAPIAPVTSDSATIPSAAPGVPAPTLPTPPVAATTSAPAVPAQPTPPTAPAPTVPKTPAASTVSASTAAPLPPGQMMLDAFRKAVLAARAKAGK